MADVNVAGQLDEIEKRIMAGLKDFQRATVNRIDELYRAGQMRVLVSDEVGLGKTLIARGTIAKLAKLQKESGDKLVKVVYVCSNASIAEQNLNKLRITSELKTESTSSSRLSMQHLNIFRQENDTELLNRYIQLIPLTPDTSFRMTSGAGIVSERALMYAILRRMPELSMYRKALEVAMADKAVGQWDGWARDWYETQVKECDKTSGGKYLAYMLDKLSVELNMRADEDNTVLDMIISMCKQIRSNRYKQQNNNAVIGKLRVIFAKISLDKLEPDLVIMDEFQRFKYLINSDSDTETGMLANKFFNSSKVRMLLLSATPYKMYSTLEEIDETQVDEHISWGIGMVTEQKDNYIKIIFGVGEKQFVYPDAFEKFLKCEDTNMQSQIEEELALKKQQEIQKQQERQQRIEEISRTVPVVNTRNGKKKNYPKENIAFKCNYCDGGKDQNGIGYLCACSDELIGYNIEVAQHSWCCNEEAPCSQYYDGIIDRETLDEQNDDGGFVCYESQMLRNWAAFAGFVLTGENKQKPMKLSKVQINSLAILTSREPYAPEKDRFVFGVFLVDEAYEGDNRDEGYVTTSSKYKISLTQKEAKKILFWNYYHNENSPEKVAWGQGLHRYITDIQAASVLYDIWKVKAGTKDEELAKEFLDHFCKINAIKFDDLPVLEGALTR